MINVNGRGDGTREYPYGGYKQSGLGREFSLEGMLDSFTQRKSVTVNLAV
jgi:betaine-aldehyde dehydrogenase